MDAPGRRSGSTSPGPLAIDPTPSGPELSVESMEAHRTRELKWMSLMASSPASQARKSKKVRKILTEGVPSSVRYLVWTYLTDGKARCVPAFIRSSVREGKSGVAGKIEDDVRVGFVGQGEDHLQGTKGGVLSLLSGVSEYGPRCSVLNGFVFLLLYLSSH